MTDRTILWRRVDQPGHESAMLALSESSARLSGTAVFRHDGQPCRLDYAVECTVDGLTQTVDIRGWVGARSIDVKLAVDDASRWRMNGELVPTVEGCLDVDLNFSPSTNLLPIRRLRLAAGEQANVRAAWLRFPSFALEPLDQMYSRVAEDTYRYSSGSFTRELTVDEVGFVLTYPGYWDLEAIL